MHWTLQRKATRKQRRIEKYLIEDTMGFLLPYTRVEAVVGVPDETKTPIAELNVIATVARSVDAIMLFRIVWTARTPFFSGSDIKERTHW